jgi:hypothetical protein
MAMAHAVRTRRELLARTIDEVAGEIPSPLILSVAAGHLREVELSRAVAEARVGRFIALDQDRDSLHEVWTQYASLGIEPLHGSVRDILRRRNVAPAGCDLRYDLIYAAGLYDYLQERTARQLTEALFALLRPGGRLLLGNFIEGVVDAAFLEAVMDWWLIYRPMADLMALAENLPTSQVGALSAWTDELNQVGYLEIRKR